MNYKKLSFIVAYALVSQYEKSEFKVDCISTQYNPRGEFYLIYIKYHTLDNTRQLCVTLNRKLIERL